MISEYNTARRRGIREMKRAVEQGLSPYPPVLDEILKDAGKLGEVPVGLKEIPVERIAGTRTAGRTNSFSCGFMPVLEDDTEFAEKWSRLYTIHEEEGIRDPVKVYEYLNLFYVEEGNKRVSVCRFVGLSSMEAEVIRLMPKKADTKEYRLYREFLDYFKVSGMYDIVFTAEGSYRRFARVLGQTLDLPWPDRVLEDLKAAWALFSQIYHQERTKRWSKLPGGDAFLVYLNFYPLESLLNEPRSILTNRIDRLWKEFAVEANEDRITILETPDSAGEPAQETGTRESFGTALLGILQPELSRKRKTGNFGPDNPLHAAFLYPRRAESSAWIYGHELGRRNLEQRMKGTVETLCYDDCGTDETLRAAVDDAVERHAEMIFTISPTQMEETMRCAIHFPQVRFLNCSINLAHSNVRTYYGRMYEAKFLMGALAASIATNHKIGYVADYPIYGIVTGINAFAIGASMIDPRAKIHLKWSTDRDSDWRQELEEEGVYVISGADLFRPVQMSREYGVYLLDPDGNVTNLAAPVWNWGRYYELIARIVLNGRWDQGNQRSQDRAINYWWGMSAGVIDVKLSNVSWNSRKLIDLLRSGIVAGTFDPFMGELRSQEGPVRDSSSRGLTSHEIITMNWLCENVYGSLPKKADLIDEAGSTVDVSGVEGVVPDET